MLPGAFISRDFKLHIEISFSCCHEQHLLPAVQVPAAPDLLGSSCAAGTAGVPEHEIA